MKESCHRFTAKRGFYQSWFFKPPQKKNGECEYYWDNNEYRSKKKDSFDGDMFGSSVSGMD